jgi:DNA-directed RNA polymerase subunit alpha
MQLTDINHPALQPSFTITTRDMTATGGTVMIEPLDQGYGHTLGNSLRRVLLTSLPGAAVTKARIEGVDHQYSTIPGVTEDTLEITLNLKQVRVATSAGSSGVMRLSVQGPATATAKDFVADAGLEVVNPDQHIATIAKGSALQIEVTVEAGIGYEVADERKVEAIGDIILDALYSPIEKVSYKVEATRVGRRTDYDRLVMQIQTDGTIEVTEAVRQAANILMQQYSQIVNPVIVEHAPQEPELSHEEAEIMRLTVEELDLPTRISNALRKGGFKTVGDLVSTPKATIAKVKNLGEKSVVVIEEALGKKGVTLTI